MYLDWILGQLPVWWFTDGYKSHSLQPTESFPILEQVGVYLVQSDSED